MSQRKKQALRIAKKASMIIMISCILLSSFALESAVARMVAVRNDNVNMRSGPGLKKKVLWKLSAGFPLKVVKRSGKWLKVKDFEGTVGWVHKNVVNRSGHMIVKAQKKSQGKINIRSKPSTRSKIVAKAYYGVVFRTLKKQKGWVKVQHGKVTGWIKRSLLWGF
ncbi:MAG: SH3 domain-containing protein [Candidatus Electrothrix aestuarii]|uniref:SH3 domain-containing protein n=1 Tax=Candidatus Electrothrix aestuarii TaxID=3062594 RepID=A0AAU8M0K1_9BACT|nr:SH3 domain-containing protein [Candidatus Electrothrix aestuarii]